MVTHTISIITMHPVDSAYSKLCFVSGMHTASRDAINWPTNDVQSCTDLSFGNLQLSVTSEQPTVSLGNRRRGQRKRRLVVSQSSLSSQALLVQIQPGLRSLVTSLHGLQRTRDQGVIVSGRAPGRQPAASASFSRRSLSAYNLLLLKTVACHTLIHTDKCTEL